MEQYEAFVAVGQIRDLQNARSGIRAAAVGPTKHAKSVAMSLDARIAILRRGSVKEEELEEIHFEANFGKALGNLTDEGLMALGIEVDQRK